MQTAKLTNKVADENEHPLEMSNYIDIKSYHEVERTHPFYIEMVDEMIAQLGKCTDKVGTVLELGAGTGLLTEAIVNAYPELKVDALEYDWKIYNQLRGFLGTKTNPICGDAVTYRDPNGKKFDVLISSFAHDHIHFKRADEFVKNIRANLKTGGHYIMGGEILPEFHTEAERVESLYLYHLFIINKALRDKHFDVSKLEIEALKSGIYSVGDFKRHAKMFEKEMSNGFKLVNKAKMGPMDTDKLGGVFVYVFQAT